MRASLPPSETLLLPLHCRRRRRLLEGAEQCSRFFCRHRRHRFTHGLDVDVAALAGAERGSRVSHDDLADVTLFIRDAAPVDVYRGQMANVLTYVRKLPARVEAFCGRRVGYDSSSYEIGEHTSERCARFGACAEEPQYRRAAVRPLGDWLWRYTGSHPGP